MAKSVEDETPAKEEWLKSTIGNFGKWQCWIAFLLSLFKFPIAWVQMSIVFLAPPTRHWCAPPLQYRNMTNEEWINLSKPINRSLDWNQLNNGFCEMRNPDEDMKIVSCSEGFDYNRTIFQSSIITEWDLVCGKARFVDLSQIILMTGILIGNILFGLYADRYGRKIILIICVGIQTFFGFLASWSPYFWVFVVSRFFLAVANGGTIVVSFVMCIEIVGGKWRSIIPILVQAPFGLGISVMAVLAYYIRDWRQFQYTISAISALFLWYLWLIPESPRWLFVKGKRKEGKKILEHAAKFNGLKPEIFEEKFSQLSEMPTDTEKRSFKDLFSTSVIAKRTVWLSMIWFISGMSIFTINQYVGHVGQNIFFSAGVAGIIPIPGLLICLVMINKFGRKFTIGFWSFMNGLSFLSIIFFPKGMYPHDWQRMAFAGIGILGLSVSVCAIYLYTGELFPTVVRNTGVGLCSVFTRIGSMLAPIVVALHDTSPFIPLLLLAVINFAQMFLILLLPETKGEILAEVIEDLETANERNTPKKQKARNHYSQVSTQEEFKT